MISIPEILQTEAEAAAVIRLTVPRSEMRKVFGPAVGELMAALTEQGVIPILSKADSLGIPKSPAT
jgi:hypothetical protein